MIRIIAVGRIKEKDMQGLILEYTKRLKPIHTLEIIELSNSVKKENDVNGIIEDESQRILSKIDDKDEVILLDLKGKDFSSVEMSEKVMGLLDLGKTIDFVIGGSHGVNQAVRDRASLRWRISNLTFPHQLVRVLLTEQIYRFFMISKNHPYHK